MFKDDIREITNMPDATLQKILKAVDSVYKTDSKDIDAFLNRNKTAIQQAPHTFDELKRFMVQGSTEPRDLIEQLIHAEELFLKATPTDVTEFNAYFLHAHFDASIDRGAH